MNAENPRTPALSSNRRSVLVESLANELRLEALRALGHLDQVARSVATLPPMSEMQARGARICRLAVGVVELDHGVDGHALEQMARAVSEMQRELLRLRGVLQTAKAPPAASASGAWHMS